jgi:hypothetical protein
LSAGFDLIPLLQQLPLWTILLGIAKISWAKFEKRSEKNDDRLKAIENQVSEIKLAVTASIPEIQARFNSLEQFKDQMELDIREIRMNQTGVKKPRRDI